jgi:hypothetical protein
MSQLTESEWKSFVEYATGGPDGCQVSRGGTCQRPDIRLNGACDPCEFSKYCLVPDKLLLTNKQEKRKIS